MDAMSKEAEWPMEWDALLAQFGKTFVKVEEMELYGSNEDIDDAEELRDAQRDLLWAHLAKMPAVAERDALRAKLDALREACVSLLDESDGDLECARDALRGFLAAVEASEEVP